MKKYYVILGQTKDEWKNPVISFGWFRNKNEALENFKKDNYGHKALYGYTHTTWEFIKYVIFGLDINIECIIIKDLK